MADVLLDRPAWYLLGPLIGLVVLGLLATINHRIGALGGYSSVLERATGRTPGLGWKAYFLLGIFGGGLVWRLAAGNPPAPEGYGWLSRTFESDLAVGGILLAGGVLIGFGAKTAGGCTSGNGLGGCGAGSPASFAATATFIGVAIAVSFVIQAAT